MDDKEFVGILVRDILESNMIYYISLMNIEEGASLDEITNLFNNIPDESRNLLPSIIRRAILDTISSVLGILDGSSAAPDYRGDFELTYDNGPNLTGYLQDILLNIDT